MSGVVSAEELSKASAAPAAAAAGEHVFEPVNVLEANKGRKEIRRIPVPPHRFGQLKRHWVEIFTPIVSSLKLQMRMNVKTRQVEIQTSEFTEDIGALQRAADFVKAFLLGFEVKDALALLRMDELYVDSFDVDDVKRLVGDNLSRAIGRIAGKDGRTRVLIENSTRTRIVLADKFAPIPLPFPHMCVSSLVAVLSGGRRKQACAHPWELQQHPRCQGRDCRPHHRLAPGQGCLVPPRQVCPSL